MDYEAYCEWFAVYGNQQQDDMDYELAARYDSINERGYDRDIAGEMEGWDCENEQLDNAACANSGQGI